MTLEDHGWSRRKVLKLAVLVLLLVPACLMVNAARHTEGKLAQQDAAEATTAQEGVDATNHGLDVLEQATSKTGEERLNLNKAALANFRVAITKFGYKRERERALAEEYTGDALIALAQGAPAAEGMTYLREAEALYQSALTTKQDPSLAPTAPKVQRKLAALLMDLAELQTDPAKQEPLLRKSVTLLRELIAHSPQETSQEARGMRRQLLASALRNLSWLVESPERERLRGEAMQLIDRGASQ